MCLYVDCLESVHVKSDGIKVEFLCSLCKQKIYIAYKVFLAVKNTLWNTYCLALKVDYGFGIWGGIGSISLLYKKYQGIS